MATEQVQNCEFPLNYPCEIRTVFFESSGTLVIRRVSARVSGSKSIRDTSTIGEFEGRWTISDRETARRQ